MFRVGQKINLSSKGFGAITRHYWSGSVVVESNNTATLIKSRNKTSTWVDNCFIIPIESRIKLNTRKLY